jgi:putative hemolysin
MAEIQDVIDAGKALRSSKSKFLRNLPQFVVRMIEKLIYQDELNAVINRNRDKTGTEFINNVLNEWNIKIELKGTENLPVNGRSIFVANHPLGGVDAMSFLSTINRYYGSVVSPSNELLNVIPNLKPILVGVNVFGRNTKATAAELDQLYGSEVPVMIFPSGEVSRRHRGSISDPRWQKSFISKAVRFHRDVIPVFISGRNSNLFYIVASLRKLLGISMYVETVLLPREMVRQKNISLTLTIGKPISYHTFDSSRDHWEWARYVKETVYQLEDHGNQNKTHS